MKCHLCRQEKKLIEAHVIPEWCFRYLYDENKSKREPLIFASLYSNGITHTGIYDKEILCGKCDSFLGKYDNYGRKVLLQTKIEILEKENNILYIIRNIDSKMLSIFFLSVLWRASISKRPEFAKVDIGPYENKIWKVLNKAQNNKDYASQLKEFPMIIRKFSGGNYSDLVDKNIQLPLFIRIGPEKINFYLLYFPRGFIVYIKTDKRDLPEFLTPFELKGKDIFIPEKDFENSEELKFMVKAMINKQKRINL